VNALKAAGNAIVPQVVAVIMQAIRELDDRFSKPKP
jgi:site-specific DNA-cytosine methylase